MKASTFYYCAGLFVGPVIYMQEFFTWKWFALCVICGLLVTVVGEHFYGREI